jgi:hypothetical protein
MRVPELHQHRKPFFLWHQDVRDHQVRAGTPRRAGRAGLRFVRKPITFAQFKATMAEVVERAGVAPR